MEPPPVPAWIGDRGAAAEEDDELLPPPPSTPPPPPPSRARETHVATDVVVGEDEVLHSDPHAQKLLRAHGIFDSDEEDSDMDDNHGCEVDNRKPTYSLQQLNHLHHQQLQHQSQPPLPQQQQQQQQQQLPGDTRSVIGPLHLLPPSRARGDSVLPRANVPVGRMVCDSPKPPPPPSMYAGNTAPPLWADRAMSDPMHGGAFAARQRMLPGGHPHHGSALHPSTTTTTNAASRPDQEGTVALATSGPKLGVDDESAPAQVLMAIAKSPGKVGAGQGARASSSSQGAAPVGRKRTRGSAAKRLAPAALEPPARKQPKPRSSAAASPLPVRTQKSGANAFGLPRGVRLYRRRGCPNSLPHLRIEIQRARVVIVSCSRRLEQAAYILAVANFINDKWREAVTEKGRMSDELASVAEDLRRSVASQRIPQHYHDEAERILKSDHPLTQLMHSQPAVARKRGKHDADTAAKAAGNEGPRSDERSSSSLPISTARDRAATARLSKKKVQDRITVREKRQRTMVATTTGMPTQSHPALTPNAIPVSRPPKKGKRLPRGLSRKVYKRSGFHAINVQRQRCKVKVANRDFPDTEAGLQEALDFLGRVDALWAEAQKRVTTEHRGKETLRQALAEEAVMLKHEVSSWTWR